MAGNVVLSGGGARPITRHHPPAGCGLAGPHTNSLGSRGDARNEQLSEESADMTTNVILLGPPGAGKGTQAKTLAERTSLSHVASGDLFRAALREGTELGMLAKSYMDRGELVPDEVVIRMILERIQAPDCADGVIFDGFPRTRDQAVALEESMAEHKGKIDGVLYLSVPNEVLLRRIAGRQTCKTCGATYNIYYFPSHRPGICDACGGKLYQRSDDSMETAQHRLDVYFQQTMPLIEYYQRQAILHEIDGQREITWVNEAMLRALGQFMVTSAEPKE
jgi:adenylate kinase